MTKCLPVTLVAGPLEEHVASFDCLFSLRKGFCRYLDGLLATERNEAFTNTSRPIAAHSSVVSSPNFKVRATGTSSLRYPHSRRELPDVPISCCGFVAYPV